MANSVDAVVIGSGPNGLAAAIRLAEHGRSVLVLEARGKLGGAVATDELTLPGFRHDTFASVFPAAIASPVWARMPLDSFGLQLGATGRGDGPLIARRQRRGVVSRRGAHRSHARAAGPGRRRALACLCIALPGPLGRHARDDVERLSPDPWRACAAYRVRAGRRPGFRQVAVDAGFGAGRRAVSKPGLDGLAVWLGAA